MRIDVKAFAAAKAANADFWSHCLTYEGKGGLGQFAWGDFGSSSHVGAINAPPATIQVPIPAAGLTITDVIETDSDTDTFALDVIAGQTYLVSVRGTGASPLADTYVRLANAGLVEIKHDDDGGRGTNSLLTFTAAYTGVHNVVVSNFPDSRILTGEYTLDVRTMGADAVPDTFAGAVSLAAGTNFGFIENSFGDIDTYKVALEAGRFYTFQTDGGVDGESNYLNLPQGELDTILVLYGPDGSFITFNDDSNFAQGDVGSSISFVAPEDGTYFLDVIAYDNLTTGVPQVGGYTVTVNSVDLSNLSPLDAIDWRSADNVDFVNVSGTPTAYVYFAVAGENFGELQGDSNAPLLSLGWNDFEKQQVMLALEEYEHILGTNYEVTTDVSQATFRLITTEAEPYGAFFYPQDPDFGDAMGIGAFNVDSGGWDKTPFSNQNLPGEQLSLERGGYSFAVILHEFGHAHGLAHLHDDGGGSDVLVGVSGAFGSYGAYDLNQGVYSVMSYNDAWELHPDGPSPFTISGIDNGWSGSLSAFDIAMLQQRYGVHAYNGGNNVYALTDVVDDAFYQTIWDSGGTDAISYGGALDATIDLTAATLDYSPTGGGMISYVYDPAPGLSPLRGGYTIANGVIIENASGGSGDDVLVGNAAGNTLTGNAGDDLLLGRDGADTLLGGDGADVLNGGAGKNELTGGAGNDLFVFEDSSAKDKIRDFDSGNDMIDLTAFGIGRNDVKITGGNVFADTDGNGSYDLHIVVQGDKVQMGDIALAAATANLGTMSAAQIDYMIAA